MKMKSCPVCDGKGLMLTNGIYGDCYICDGKGSITCNICDGSLTITDAPVSHRQPCPACSGTGQDRLQDLIVDDRGNTIAYENIDCRMCEGAGTISDEPVSHCQGCGQTVELGVEWCDTHRPVADLWGALNPELT